MPIDRRTFVGLGAGALGATAISPWAAAQAAEDASAFPSRAIKLILPYTPGGAPDLLARNLQKGIEQAWQKPFVIESQPGANGTLACGAVAKSPPDGYTLVMGSVATHAINATFYPKLQYKPIESFAPVTQVGQTPLIITGNPKVPAKTLSELIAYGRANPGKLTYASVGNGSLGHLAAELFSLETGVKMVHVAYRGISQASLDLVSGQYDLAFSNIVNVLEFINADKLRPFAVTSKERLSILPNVPAAAEVVPNFETTLWWGIFASGGTPRGIVDKLNKAMVDVLKEPELRASWTKQGVELTGSSPDALATLLKADIAKWAKAVNAIKT